MLDVFPIDLSILVIIICLFIFTSKFLYNIFSDLEFIGNRLKEIEIQTSLIKDLENNIIGFIQLKGDEIKDNVNARVDNLMYRIDNIV
jgi:hypothetical protein